MNESGMTAKAFIRIVDFQYQDSDIRKTRIAGVEARSGR